MANAKPKKEYVRPEVREHQPLIGLTLQSGSDFCSQNPNDPSCQAS
jgi:hypothetical protein